ncbi:hypothetical protein [Schaalia suimastitidis]|uniref:hypothetical protein n=1 Tax=Schaalia suimastitidis TaxID=121163 RepID=UPI0004168FDB|nr:hypothetical protein [Schaalia suimastitidis]
MSEVSVDVEQNAQACQQVLLAEQDAAQAVARLDTAYQEQTAAKWGVQVGPRAFQSVYSMALQDVMNSIGGLESDLATFEAGMRQVREEFADLDTAWAAFADGLNGDLERAGQDVAQGDGSVNHRPSDATSGVSVADLLSNEIQ